MYLKTIPFRTEVDVMKKLSYNDNVYAWLHCTFGYVKVNLQKAEITETYTKNNPDYPTTRSLCLTNFFISLLS